MITTKENKMNTNEMNKKAKFIHRNEKHKKIIIQSEYLWKPEGPEENHHDQVLHHQIGRPST